MVSLTQYLWNSYISVPVVTRYFTTASLLVTLAVQLDIITVYNVYFNPWLTFNRMQLWRLITCFLYLGNLDISSLFSLLFFYRFSQSLETGDFADKTDEFIMMFFFALTAFLATSVISGPTILSDCMSYFILYVWSRRNPEAQIEFHGVFVIRAAFFPIFLLAGSIVLGGGSSAFIVGFIFGHIYYHAKFVFPNSPHGFPILEPPEFLSRWCGRQGQTLSQDVQNVVEDIPEEYGRNELPSPERSTEYEEHDINGNLAEAEDLT